MAGKEWIQVRRDSRSLILSLLAPVFLVLLFGYALNMDVKNVAIAVLDMDRSSTSRQFIEGFAHNEYLTIHSYAENYGDLDGLLDSGAAALALVIPTGFARRLEELGVLHREPGLAGGRCSYSLTEAGLGLERVIAAIRSWAAAHLRDAALRKDA